MPSRWWVPVETAAPDDVTPVELHRATTRWFDLTDAEHHRQEKPYAISPLYLAHGWGWGFEVGVLTGDARARLIRGARQIGLARLGARPARAQAPILLREATWQELAATQPSRRWALEFASPTSFRTGSRSSPMPDIPKILHSLSSSWSFSPDVSAPTLAPAERAHLWVSSLEAKTVEVDIGHLELSAMVGQIVIDCERDEVSRALAGLLAVAPYAGVGAGRYKGLGVTRIRPVMAHSRFDRASAASLRRTTALRTASV